MPRTSQPHGRLHRIRHPGDDAESPLRHGAINLAQGFPGLRSAGRAPRRGARPRWTGPPPVRRDLGRAAAAAGPGRKDRPVLRPGGRPGTELVVTCGATEAMMVAMMTVCDPGDRVGMFSPFYENYGADAILCGARRSTCRSIPGLSASTRPSSAGPSRRSSRRFVLCNPSNPMGRVFTPRRAAGKSRRSPGSSTPL